MDRQNAKLLVVVAVILLVGMPSPGRAHRAYGPSHQAGHQHRAGRGALPLAQGRANFSLAVRPSYVPIHSASERHDQINDDRAELTYLPPTFAITPRVYGATYGPAYFDRTSEAGPAKRGRAYNVRRRW